MVYRKDVQDFGLGAELAEAILSRQGKELDAELGRIARALLASPQGGYLNHPPLIFDSQRQISRAVLPGSFYVVSGKEGGYGEKDHELLTALANLTVKLFAVKLELGKRQQQSAQVQDQQQAHTLEQMEESVIKMDMSGFITNWNSGAERLFGYTAAEALGKNILFLYDDEEADGLQLFDSFLEQGGREMEVRRRKKSGEVFWASLILSPLYDESQQASGIVAYLSDITERKHAEEKINYLAYYDLLTGLPNRALFKKLVDKALQQFQRNGCIGSLLFIDLSRMQTINDTLGRHIGDLVLMLIAERLRLAVRENDVIARLSENEFAVVLLEINQHHHAGMVAQKLLQSLDQPIEVEGHELVVGARIGISVYPQDGRDADHLIRRADIAMFKAKRGETPTAGYAYYNQEIHHGVAGRLFLEAALRRALERQEFSLQYQPKIDICSGNIIGVEALLRWTHPDRGLTLPAEFLAVAEETGMILQMDAWVLDQACAQASRWRARGLTPLRMAVNLSAKEFSETLPMRIRQALDKHGLEPDWLELEITEGVLMNSTTSVIEIMRQITEMGVTLALDDFGTGYSSLSYLRRFPISRLKIDRSFIRGIPGDASDCAVSGAIIGVGKQLKQKIVAEGVESLEQLAFLREAGCDEVQGYLFSRPVDADKLDQLLHAGIHFAL